MNSPAAPKMIHGPLWECTASLSVSRATRARNMLPRSHEINFRYCCGAHKMMMSSKFFQNHFRSRIKYWTFSHVWSDIWLLLRSGSTIYTRHVLIPHRPFQCVLGGISVVWCWKLETSTIQILYEKNVKKSTFWIVVLKICRGKLNQHFQTEKCGPTTSKTCFVEFQNFTFFNFFKFFSTDLKSNLQHMKFSNLVLDFS